MNPLNYLFGKKEGEMIQAPMDPYGQINQGIDPSMIPLLNAPSMANFQIAQSATNNEEVVSRFKEGLRGFKTVKRFNVNTGKTEDFVETFSERSMNETGVNELARELETYLGKSFILSNIPKEDKRRIDALGRIVWGTLNRKLIVNADRYELDKTRRATIVHEMVFTILSNVMRSFDDGMGAERSKFYGSQRTVQSINQTGSLPQPVKKSMWGF